METQIYSLPYSSVPRVTNIFNKSLITSALFFKDIPQLRFAGRHSSPHSRLVGSLDVETRQRSRQLQYPLLNCAGWLTRHRAPGRVVPSFVARRGPRRWRGRLVGTFRKLIYMSYTLNQLSYLRRGYRCPRNHVTFIVAVTKYIRIYDSKSFAII